MFCSATSFSQAMHSLFKVTNNFNYSRNTYVLGAVASVTYSCATAIVASVCLSVGVASVYKKFQCMSAIIRPINKCDPYLHFSSTSSIQKVVFLMSDVYFCIKDNYIQLISSQLLIDVYMQKFWFQNTRKCVSLLYIVLV